MANRQFISKAFERIHRLDKENLSRLITQLTHERDFLMNIVQFADEGILVFEQDLKLIFMNQKAALYLRIDKQIPDSYLSDVISDHALQKVIENAVYQKKEIFGELFELLEPRPQKFRITLRDLSRGQYMVLFYPEEFHGTKAEEEHQIDKLSTILSLATGIAHEIGNPLNSINVHLHLLEKDIEELPKNQKQSRLIKYLKVVREETKRLDGIVHNFLNATRRKPVQFQLGSITDILKNLTVLFEPEFKQKKIRASLQLDKEIPLFFLDMERLNQVFINLIKNAIQAMPKGGKINISVVRQKDICIVCIADTGVGIKQEEIPKIFDAYYTTKEEGTGLGLVIAYQIIREHSGRIEVVSKPGKGTLFRVLLPIRREKLQLPSPLNEQRKNHEQFI